MKKKNLDIFFSLTLILLCLFFYYHQFILSPNSYLTTASGDGIKAYTVFAGHIKNDSSYHEFRNMNYPYGQTHVFTDGQTAIANAVKFFAEFHPYFETHSIGIYNLLMIFSYAACAFFLCLILLELRLPSLFVILGSVGITLLSPQIFRMGGHLTLSYAVFFPFSWWLFIRFFNSEKKMYYTMLMVINSTTWFFVHPYFVMMNTVFYSGCYFVLTIQDWRSVIKKTSAMVYALTQIAIPLILTRIYIVLADHHPPRSEHPYGFWVYFAKLNTVFAPVNRPLDAVFQKLFDIEPGSQSWEGWAYIGLPSVMIAIYAIFRIMRYLVKGKFKQVLKPVLPLLLQSSVWAAVLALFFSMCLPFRLNIPWLNEHRGFIEQFRSLGRFAWIFYYVFTVYAVYVSYLVYRKWKMKHLRVVAFAWPVFLFSMFFIESHAYHVQNLTTILTNPNVYNLINVPADMKETIGKVESMRQRYQCIIPLPYYNVGNENFDAASSDEMIYHSMIISYYTNLPLLSNSAARSPIDEGKKIMQFFSPPVFKKEIQDDLPDKRPFLILFDHEKLSDEEKYWLKRSGIIFQNNSYSLYELPYDSVFGDISETEIKHFEKQRDSLINYNGLLVTSTADTILYFDFENLNSPIVFRGKGALNGIKKNYNKIFEKTNSFLRKGEDYIISFWYYNKGELRNQISCVLEECDREGRKCDWEILFSPMKSRKIYGDWSLVEKRFRVKPETEMISLFFKGDDRSSQEFYVDDLIVRPAHVDVYYRTDPVAETYRADAIKSFFMFRGLQQEETIRHQQVTKMETSIRSNPEWMKSIEEKARVRSISVDSMIFLDAIYIYEEESKKNPIQ